MISTNDSLEPTTNTSFNYDYQKEELNLTYAICEVLVAIVAVVGNALVIIVFRKERRLRRRTNYYIVSLAAADFLVGLLGIPFAILSSIGLPTNFYACLFTVSLLLVLCTISIFCLVAVSIDRYWAILHPMAYSRNVRTKTALVIISVCWMAGSIIGFLPLMGWNSKRTKRDLCFFLGVMDYNYLVFLYFGTIITPALLLAAFYAHIYRVVLKQIRQIVTMNPEKGSSGRGSSTGGTMLRMLGAAQKREVKATQNLAIIVLFFMICWIPLYTINCILAFCEDCGQFIPSTFMFFCIILSHLNSAGNPLLYAYHLKDFRAALKSFIWNMFGVVENVPSNNYRASLASNIGANNNFNHPSKTLRESRSAMNLTSQSRPYVESPLYFRNKSKSMNLPTPPKLSSVVKSTAILAAINDTNRDIWKISEVSEEICNEKDDYISIVATPYKQRKLSDNGRINTAYVDGIYFEDDNDEVFVDDTLPIAEFRQKLTTNNCDSTVISASSKSSPSQPLLTSNLFLVETEMMCKDKFPVKFIRSCSVIETAERPKKKNLRLSLSGDFILSPNRNKKSTCQFKAMEELLLQTKHSRSLSDGSSVSSDTGSRKKNGTLLQKYSFGS